MVSIAKSALSGDQLARRNAVFLALAVALAGANATVVFSTGALIGLNLSGDTGWATIPLSCFVVGTALFTYPASIAMKRFGRRSVFMLGNTIGIWAGLIGALAIYLSSFTLFCIATGCCGLYHAVIGYYRFAAADTATPAFRPKAISWVLTGGIGGAIVGPQLVIASKELAMPYLFLATFIGQAMFAAIAMMFTSRFQDAPVAEENAGTGRPLLEIARTPRFIVAAFCGMSAQALMNLVMTSAPLAMAMCGHSVTDSTLGIQWHVLAMYGPSFFTGSIIARFGKERVVALGMAILASCAVVDLSGISVMHFWVGLSLLGVGWNFAFIAATSIVTDCHTPAERNKVQGLNDTLIFGTTAFGSFLSGHLLATVGWNAINWALIPIAATCALAALGLHAFRTKTA